MSRKPRRRTPWGIPVTMLQGEVASKDVQPSYPSSHDRESLTADEASDATEGEGDLSSDANEIGEHTASTVVEAKENVLKD